MNLKRIQRLNNSSYTAGGILYWMSRDQRVNDNWALIYAQELALTHNVPLAVAFALRPTFRHATERLIDFMLTGLEEVEKNLALKKIPFFFLLGDPVIEMPKFIEKNNIGFLISDFSPLKYNRFWKEKICDKISIPFHEVDAHNIVPVWQASQKQEFGAYTLRPKINRLLPEFLEEFPKVSTQNTKWLDTAKPIDWKGIKRQITTDSSVKPVDWIRPGEREANKKLDEFLERRIKQYSEERNDPTKNAQSDLSPYIHFGHISSQRIALEVHDRKVKSKNSEAFLEELIVRKELSDNFCYFNKDYDNSNGFPAWAKKTLEDHAYDKREYIYSLGQLEKCETHDELWNSAQKEMIHRGKMHGYMRMYWAKKIYEWSPNVDVAQKNAIYLNDKYFLDGRDPNGYTGIAWSMGGVHDRAWFEREIFGKIRYMNYNGAKSKFDINKYIRTAQLL